MILTVVTAEREYYRGEIAEVLLPSVEGEIAVMPGHAPFVIALKAGPIEIREPGGQRHHLAITGGLVEIRPQEVAVLALSAAGADNLEETAIAEAKERAQQARQDAQGDEEYAVAAAALERALAQEKTLERRKRWRK